MIDTQNIYSIYFQKMWESVGVDRKIKGGKRKGGLVGGRL